MTAETAPQRRMRITPEALEQIKREAKAVHPVAAILMGLGSLIVGVVWCIGKAWIVAFQAGGFVYAAGRYGWRLSQGQPTNQPTYSELAAENDALRKAIARVDPGG